MKVTIQRFGGDVPADLAGFADYHGLEMVVRERDAEFAGGNWRFYAHFKDAEVMERGCLCGEFGNGATPDLAMRDYAIRIAGKRIAIDARRACRRNIDVPNDLHFSQSPKE